MTWEQQLQKVRAPRLAPSLVADAVGPDGDRMWMPESLTPLGGTGSYAALTPQQKRVYNQHCALQLAEEFAWIEDTLIIAPLRGLLKGNLQDKNARGVLESFIRDEEAHVAAFTSLRNRGAGVVHHAPHLFSPGFRVTALARLTAAMPRQTVFWLKVVERFETYAIEISRAYREDTGLDDTFKTVFLAHGQDEARHVQYDALLSDLLAEVQPGWLSRLNTGLHDSFFRSYYDPEWGLKGPIAELVRHCPELAPNLENLLAEAQAARSSAVPYEAIN